MSFCILYKRKFAAIMLMIWVTDLIAPSVSFALTSGPSQPETLTFQPVGVSDMVDLATGDFKYNIPLLDIDGYPINLNYQSGSGIDDEASWVGLGWNLNVGAINRQLRGVPDDFSGDTIITEHYTKPKITIGGRVTGKVEVKGGARLQGSFSLGVFSDNYTGIGAEIGVNAGMSFSLSNSGYMTAGMGIGVLSNTASGVDVSPYVSLSIRDLSYGKIMSSASLGSSLGYNSRSGLKDVTLQTSFNVSTSTEPLRKALALSEMGSHHSNRSFISYNTEPLQPSIQIPYHSTYGSFSFDIGPTAFLVFTGVGGTGYKSVRQVKYPVLTNRAYGFLYSEKGKDRKDAVMDFIREKDNPVIPELPNLALPVHTPDLFLYNSQVGSGEFRLYRGGTGAFFDNEVTDDSEVTTLGFDLGAGLYAHAGVTLFDQTTNTTSRKWKGNNDYLKVGDFQSASSPLDEPVSFRIVGEKIREDETRPSLLNNTDPLAVVVSGKNANNQVRNQNGNSNVINDLKKKGRQIKKAVVSYLTASEASRSGADRKIFSYPFNDLASFTPPSGHNPNSLNKQEVPRIESKNKKADHISEITVTDEQGKRIVYGLPVYNLKQEEYSFAVGEDYLKNPDTVNYRNNLPSIFSGNTIDYKKGIDHYFHKTTTPAYASSFLITSILSPDYQDNTGQGISDDDIGTALKFNYSKLPGIYRWRSPYNGATLNKCLLADPNDDKASIVYGEKEVWYVHSIESKTKIVYFITENRRDALGVSDIKGNPDTGGRLKCLREIRLYSKADMSRPIKVVKLKYNYTLCPRTPNSDSPERGKLTLETVHFEYGTTKKGSKHQYKFTYNNNPSVAYGNLKTDRWGVYKPSNGNGAFNLANDEFPYTRQNDRVLADANVSLWQLSKIVLPTGGLVTINYEADDYAFVQNKRAMVMSEVKALIKDNGTETESLTTAKGVRVALTSNERPPKRDTTSWFKDVYLNGSDYIYAKLYVRLSTQSPDLYDFVPCYAKIKEVHILGNYANVIFEDTKESGITANPILFAAWQRMKEEYPRFAYPGYDSRAKDNDIGKSVQAVVRAIVTSVKNLSELKENFYQKAARKGLAGKVILAKSFVRLVKTDGRKIGGGLRVKKINISDEWQNMTSNTSSNTGVYGQEYDYTTKYNGLNISSGVASNEPSIGNDESALREPVPYVQKRKGGINSFFTLEEPFGESFFPAPNVVYSRVTVKDLGAGGDSQRGTGSTVNEFYTAKDFPVKVSVLPIIKNEYRPKSIYSLVKVSSVHELTLSQGYKIELNDMHGKLKGITVKNQSGAEISSVAYFYKSESSGMGEMKLRNDVDVISEDAKVSHRVIGQDVEFFTDFREQESLNSGNAINVGSDITMGIFGFPLPIPHFPKKENTDYRLFRSACAVKVIQNYGLIDKIIKTENGSSVTTQNIAYESNTGDVLVTRTDNEFRKSVYSITLPAYWVYKAMGGAWQNQGLVLKDFKTDEYGIISNESYNSFLNEGDQLMDTQSGISYWIIQTNGYKRVVDRKGKIQRLNVNTAKVVTSHFKNLLQSSAQTVVCMVNPIKEGVLKIGSMEDLAHLKILNASATTFSEDWINNAKNNEFVDSRVENKDYVFTFSASANHEDHGVDVCLPIENGRCYWVYNTWSDLRLGLRRSGIWLNASIESCLDEWIGFETQITIPNSGNYTFGYAGDDELVVKLYNHQMLSGTPPIVLPIYCNESGKHWNVLSFNLQAGKYTLEVEGLNRRKAQGYNNTTNNPGAMGVEIYTGTWDQLRNGQRPNIIFSTRDLLNDPNLQTFRTVNGVRVPRFTYPQDYRTFINPFVNGLKGIWNVHQDLILKDNRVYNSSGKTKKGIDVQGAGFFKKYYSYWTLKSGKWMESNFSKNWTAVSTTTQYDKYGQQLENKNELGLYSSVKYDFKGERPASLASNALNREIYISSFEDSRFRGVDGNDTIGVHEFFKIGSSQKIYELTSDISAHSGRYSAVIPVSGIKLKTVAHQKMHEAGITKYLGLNSKSEYQLLSSVGLVPRGFEPLARKKYIFNAWVKDKHPYDKGHDVNLYVNGGLTKLSCKAVVEGWKLIYGEFDTPQADSDLELKLSVNDSGVLIDDIRIFPFDSNIRSYAYDERSMRLMAEIDENCFATFYEYDDEGTLVRVKKETERGIMTIKESRSSFRRR